MGARGMTGGRCGAIAAATVAAVAAALVAPPPAAALAPGLLGEPRCETAFARYYDGGLPAPRTAAIHPGRAMAGVALGDGERALVDRWGTPFEDGSDGTFWMDGRVEPPCVPHARGTYAFATTTVAGRVASLAILRGRPDELAWRTPEGIGLGSRAGAVRRAYPTARRDVGHLHSAGVALVLAGPGGAVTVFRLAGPRVWAISIEAPGIR